MGKHASGCALNATQGGNSGTDNRALNFMREEHMDAAIRDFSEALDLDPNSDDAHAHRGLAYLMDLRDAEAARRDLQTAQALNPANVVSPPPGRYRPMLTNDTPGMA
ncbi:MAG: hypothetical protein DIU71_13395 [Proteobacteria bacterium]|nr:MAG: hypothetical protein DIU71_13395 [Pseudomonadota bacterium]